MKQIMIVLLSITMVTCAAAKMPAGHFGGGFHGGGFGSRTTVIVGGGYYSPFYSPFGLSFGYPFYPYANVPAQPTKLDVQVAGIKNDYADKIDSVKMDNSLTGKERRQKVREFKRDRDQAVMEAKEAYYKS